MSTPAPKWKKRWLYDSKVEIPKTTKWRRSGESASLANVDNSGLGDVGQDIPSETIHGIIDLGNNTSPFKKRRILRDCLSNRQSETLPFFTPVSEGNFDSLVVDSPTKNVEATERSYLDDASNNGTDLLHRYGEIYILSLILFQIRQYLVTRF